MKKLASFSKTIYRIEYLGTPGYVAPIAGRSGNPTKLTDKEVMLISMTLSTSCLNNVPLEDLACHVALNDSAQIDLTENINILMSHVYCGSIPAATANFQAMWQTTYRSVDPGTIIVPANQSVGIYMSMGGAAIGQRMVAFATLQWIYI